MARLLVLSFFIFLLALPVFAQDRPNIVFLLTDDQTTYSLGCYGNTDVKTPNIDGLARDGLTFDRHYVTTAICMASRASIMTGMFEYKTGCNFEHGAMLRQHWQKSYPILLRQAGYHTAMAGKIGFEVAETPNKKGSLPKEDFDAWGAGPGQTHYQTSKNSSMAKYAKDYPHSSRSYGAFGRDFIRESAKSKQPFCLSISFKAPHKPDTPDPIDDHIYTGKVFKKPANYGREHGQHFSKQSQQGRQYERFHSWGYATDYDNIMKRYHQQVYAIDAAVGMIREALTKHGVENNTVVIFTSDNGFFCGSHGYGSKVLPYEESSRVPMIFFDPRKSLPSKLARTRALTGGIDIAPTILDLAGLPIPANMDGKSLLSLYQKPTATMHTSLPLINVWGPKATHSLAVVTQDQKYVFWPYGDAGFTPTEEIYDLANDPLESKNAFSNGTAEPLRRLYDQAVQRWKAQAVPYHRYQEFGTFFDRTLPWAEKRPTQPKS